MPRFAYEHEYFSFPLVVHIIFAMIVAVREIFSVYLNRGVKSMLNEAERVENVKNDVVNISWIVHIIFEYSLVGP